MPSIAGGSQGGDERSLVLRSCRRLIRLVVLATATGGLSTAAGGCISISGSEPSGPPRVTVADSLTTVRLDQPTPATAVSGGASLIAAKNEFESFQIVVDAGRALSDVSVASGKPLRGPGGAVIPAGNLTFYREVSYRVGTPAKPTSDSEGDPGLWPDALIPARDYFYGERRSAFPVDIPAGEKMVAWIDVLAPAGQRSGTYHGSVLVRDRSGLVDEVRLSVRVLGFSIPSTSSLDSAFGLDWPSVCEAFTADAHCGGNLQRRWLLDSLFARAGLENRITLSIPVPTDSDSPPRSAAELRYLARYVIPMIQGTDRSLRIPGARLTSMNISWFCLDTDRRCLQGWRQLAGKFGFTDRFALYLCDEPSHDPSLWRECRQRAARADRQWPGVRKLVTATIQEVNGFGGRQIGGGSFLSQIDVLAALVNDVDGIEGTAVSGDQRPTYNAYLSDRRGARKSLWLYASCRSYGCGDEPVDSALTVGWPGYAIDQPAAEARAMGWLGFEYRVGGELYYQTAARLPSAWTDQYESGGNGDGTLFYPGTPRGGHGRVAIGGHHDIPIESIRLKRIRDGREDYEYLRILAAQGRRAAAMRVVRGLFGPPSVAMHSADVEPLKLNRARSELAAMIAG
jgi:hypothetical protein